MPFHNLALPMQQQMHLVKVGQAKKPRTAIFAKPKNSLEILRVLKSHMKRPCEMLTVDKEDLVSDALYHYKSRDFDATTPLCI